MHLMEYHAYALCASRLSFNATNTHAKWEAWSKDYRPADIPGNPNVKYADEGWVSHPDRMGYGRAVRH